MKASIVGVFICLLIAGGFTAMLGGKHDDKKDDNKTGFSAALSGLQEVPPISTAGTGEFSAQIDESTKSITFTLSYSDLRAPATAAHIHFAPGGINGGVMVFLCGTPATPCPTTAGTVTGTITAAAVQAIPGQGIAAGDFDPLLDAIRTGNAYANVRSVLFPAGEIRGQIIANTKDGKKKKERDDED
jgi:hypothetical protein